MNYQQRLDEHKRLDRQRTAKRLLRIGFFALLAVGFFGVAAWYVITASGISDEDIISRVGLHWHPELTTYIKGQKQEIPANIGLGITHNPIHTHDTTGVIHLEFDGLVTKDSIRLGKFFKIWGKQFNIVKMLVNGVENQEFENYVMRDLDKIEIYAD